MSNRNFDNQVIIQRLQNKVYARNLYIHQINGKSLINNPQTTNGDASQYNRYGEGVETMYFQGLQGAAKTIDIGGIVAIPPYPPLYTITSVPFPPVNLIATAGNGQVTISFTAGSNGGSVITNYLYSLNGGEYTSLSPADTVSPITITGLTNGTTYNIQLKAINAIGTSVASDIIVVTPATVPNPPTGLIATPGDGQAIISFTAGFNGGSAITNYEYNLNGGVYIALSPADASSPITITGLTNGTTYNIQLKAINTIGTSAASNVVVVTPSGLVNGGHLLIELDANNYNPVFGLNWYNNISNYNGVYALLINGPIFNQLIPANKYFSFNGINQYASISTMSIIGVSSQITIQFWMKINNVGTLGGMIIQRNTVTNMLYSLAYTVNKSIRLIETPTVWVTSTNIITNNWALYTAVISTISGGNTKLYINTTNVLNNIYNGPFPGSLGLLDFPVARQGPSNIYGQCDIGAVYYYDIALTDAQIAQNFNVTRARYGI